MKFPCEKCGACCRAVRCRYLDGNLCSIYDHRPDFCNVDKMYELSKPDMTKADYYRMNKESCEYLRKKWLKS